MSNQGIKLAGLPTPAVAAGQMPDQEQVVAQQQGHAVPEPRHFDVEISSPRDVSGITGKGAAAEYARLISQFGIPSVVLGTFLAIFVGGLWFVRQDYIASDKYRTDANERSNKLQIESHERVTKDLINTFQLTNKERREDAREDTAANREHQSKMWQGMRELTNATKENAVEVRSVAGLLSKQLEEIRKFEPARK